MTFLSGQDSEPEGALHLCECLLSTTQPRRFSVASKMKSNTSQFNITWYLQALTIEKLVCRTTQLALGVKNPPASVGDIRTMGSVPGSGRFPGEGNGSPFPVFLPGESPWTEEPRGLWSIGSQRVGHD